MCRSTACGTGCVKSFAGTAKVLECLAVQPDVFLLKLSVPAPAPQAGQFYMLRARPSENLLCRPISVYRCYQLEQSLYCVEFLILRKGKGTAQLCALAAGSQTDIIGPLGNSFEVSPDSQKKIALVGGGIGIAPIAGFAERLADKSYDFYAAFRSVPYGLDYVKPQSLFVCTDDGSAGLRGILPVIFGVKEARSYDLVCACGPDALLAYVQKICREAGTHCLLSTEAHMACGVGACLGCTVKTVHGNKRCCKDGPVFNGSDLIFQGRS